MPNPIQVVVLRDPDEPETDEHVASLRLAFEGSSGAAGSPNAYLDTAVDLKIHVWDPPSILQDVELERLLAAAERTVLVILDSGGVAEAAVDARASVQAANVVQVDLPTRPTNSDVQLAADGPIERSLLPVATALRAMECARRTLQHDVDPGGGVPRFFISHAKREGVPLALSLVGLLQQLRALNPHTPDFDYSYDADHIEAGARWSETIEEAAKRSLLIVLRTDGYESRDWCMREYVWAESNRMPVLVVDMRTRSFNEASRLPFDAAPTVRVQDGNVVRVLLHALATHIRALRLQRMAPGRCAVLPHKPTVYSLGSAREALVERGASRPTIAYPYPPLPPDFVNAVYPNLAIGGAAPSLVTYDQIEFGE